MGTLEITHRQIRDNLRQPAQPRVALALHNAASMGPRDRGFTLIEMMFAVVVLGILVAVAVDSFTGYVRKARATEVVEMFGELKSREDTYHAEFGKYLPACPSPSGPLDMDCAEGNYWPATLPGKGQQMDATSPPARWQTLHVHTPKGYLYCQYEVVAGLANEAGAISTVGTILFPTTPTRNYFYVMGRCDWDGDNTTFAEYWQRDDLSELGKKNEGS